jgi:hypothetical protein
VCMYNLPKCEVNVGSLQNIQTNKKQWASPFYVLTLSLKCDLRSTSDKLFFSVTAVNVQDMVAANWLLLQAFLECHQPHHKHSSHGMSQRSATLLALQSIHCGTFYLILFSFCIRLQTHQRSKQFFPVETEMCFQ